MKKTLLIILTVCFCNSIDKLFAQVALQQDEILNIGPYVCHYIDNEGRLEIDSIAGISPDIFFSAKSEVPNFRMSKATVWTRLSLAPHSQHLLLEVGNRRLDRIYLYIKNGNTWQIQKSGDDLSVEATIQYRSRHNLFDIPPSDKYQEILMEIRSKSPLLFPLHIGSLQAFYNRDIADNLFNGIYFGFLIIMILYNLFVFLSFRDKTYIFYILYVSLFGISQAFVNGYTNIFFPADFASFLSNYPTVFPALMLFAVLLFTQQFLQTKKFIPVLNRMFILLYLLFAVNLLLDFLHQTFIAYQVIQAGALVNTLFLLIVSIIVFRKGNKAARFYLLGWTCFLIGISLYVLREWGIIPVNFITSNFMQIGSALEVTLLSFALADKINIYKKEKEEALNLSLVATKEKQELIQNQNIILEQRVEERTKEINSEKKKSDNLLHNILPEEVAAELKAKGQSTAKQFDNVTVLFTDFVNFTGISMQLSPTALVAEIHKNFTAFDAIMEKHGLEKIKTIGDAYLAVCGLPNETNDHAQRVVRAAQDIQKHTNASDSKFQIRIGIHSGSVVAGIVGVKKFAYDIWGDTVNTAARMEQHSEAGRINISETTYQLVKNDFECTYRGKIAAKNKGEADMYFVETAF